jgi:hypothetical protein
MTRIRLTTRRLMVLVSVAAILISGLHGGPQPGWHYRLGGVEVGACRNDGFGRGFGPHGEPGSRAYQVGAWRAPTARDRTGPMVTGLRVRDWILTAWIRDVGVMVW